MSKPGQRTKTKVVHRPLRKNEYLGIKRVRSGRRRKIREWARQKFDAEPDQIYTPWLPLEEHEWLKDYCERGGIPRNEAILQAVRLLQARQNEAGR